MSISDPPVIWVGTTTFRKNNTPVLGTLGVRAERVMIMTTEVWQQLCCEFPDLGLKTFKVGDLDG